MKKIRCYRLQSFVLMLVLLPLVVFSHSDRVHAAASVPKENNGVVATPLLGWSSWSSIRRNPTEANIEAQTQALATTLKTHEYQYVNLDDFWYLNPATTVDQLRIFVEKKS